MVFGTSHAVCPSGPARWRGPPGFSVSRVPTGLGPCGFFGRIVRRPRARLACRQSRSEHGPRLLLDPRRSFVSLRTGRQSPWSTARQCPAGSKAVSTHWRTGRQSPSGSQAVSPRLALRPLVPLRHTGRQCPWAHGPSVPNGACPVSPRAAWTVSPRFVCGRSRLRAPTPSRLHVRLGYVHFGLPSSWPVYPSRSGRRAPPGPWSACPGRP